MLRVTVLTVAVLLLSLCTAQQPQRQQRQPVVQQQQRPVQQQQQQLRPANVRPGDLSLIASDTRISQLSDENLQNFLANEESVALLTNCFVNPKGCKSQTGINLINQIRKLGLGGSCSDCNRAEQERLNDNIYNFVLGYQTKYPRYWRQVLPEIGHILAGK